MVRIPKFYPVEFPVAPRTKDLLKSMAMCGGQMGDKTEIKEK